MSKKCEHQYLPDEDGTVYTCGTDENLTLTEFGWLCDTHLDGAKEEPCHCGEDGYYHCAELRWKVDELRDQLKKQQALWDMCRKFIDDLEISHPETVYQSDRVIEASYSFMHNICNLVGYHERIRDEEEE